MQLAHKLLATRGGTFLLAGLAAILSAGALLAYLNRYRESVTAGAQPANVLVAKSLIEKGTPGTVIGSQELFQPTTLPSDQVKEGAITDPAALRGRVAAEDVYPGQQLTVADFTFADASAIGAKLADDQRAISVSLDAAHGMIGDVRAGDHVDVLAGFNVVEINRNGVPMESGRARPLLRTILEDVLVLSAPTADAAAAVGSTTAKVTLRMNDREAAQVAFAADNGKLWLVLRPRIGGSRTASDVVSLETLLLGVKPVTALRSFGGRR